MLKLLLYRLYIKNINIIKTLLIYIFVFTVTMCFSSLLITIWYNNVSPYLVSKYSYVMTNFDENNMKDLADNNNVIDMYSSRIVSTEIKNDENVEKIDINIVDKWDNKSISYFGINRKTAGSIDYDGDDGIILDVLLARKIHVSVGDKISIKIKDEYIDYTVIMLIEPINELGIGQGVCLNNEKFREKWNEKFEEQPALSLLFLETNKSNDFEDYLYNEYIGPDTENESMDSVREINRSTIIKKEWSIEDVESELEHTPPVTVCISILGIIIIFIFVWRESSSKSMGLEKNNAILVSQGAKSSLMTKLTIVGQEMIIIPSIILSGIIVKVLYDNLITNYYLPMKIILTEMVVVIIISFMLCLVVGVCLNKKISKKNISQILKSE